MSNFFEKWAQESVEHQRLLAEEEFILDVTENIWEEMERQGVNKTQLAERLGKSKAYVSQLLNGSRNMTLRTLADICFALEAEPKFSIHGSNGDWQSGNVIRMSDYLHKRIEIPEMETNGEWAVAQ
ncbi:helix-turn-helix transcriptional regulator [Alcanivorax sp.]|uniref:helix-turn-helix domain-containing protein n=1 Tax=Alcanivorax sp. TaxID=1872427 RepID=UPI0025883E91|nr:helix-turn-helix transcriptional regulator [Alcanivorax sp.]